MLWFDLLMNKFKSVFRFKKSLKKVLLCYAGDNKL